MDKKTKEVMDTLRGREPSFALQIDVDGYSVMDLNPYPERPQQKYIRIRIVDKSTALIIDELTIQVEITGDNERINIRR